jgi:hypothetical protein
MTTVVISPSNVANFPDGGGHFWVYMQYVHGLRRLGCEVFWLERFRPSGDPSHDVATLSAFFERMARYGLRNHLLLYASHPSDGASTPFEYIGVERSMAEAICRRADLLLNFQYTIEPGLLDLFRRTALVDIDPGLLQFWISTGQLVVPRHDVCFTTGETVGSPAALFPNCGLRWIPFRPPVCLDRWPMSARTQDSAPFTTVSNWWGGDGTGRVEWISDGSGVSYENTKRVSFLEFSELPRLTSQALELALCLGDGDEGDRQNLEALGWRVRHATEVARTPEMYQAYIQGSRGEFSCAKPSCMRFQNAWISDRTLCYLASGKPVVVQNTGPSSFLPNGEGMFRFSTVHEAVEALAAINAGYAWHCRAAREIAEAHFDATHVLRHVLNIALP